jgi:hypothetical protein
MKNGDRLSTDAVHTTGDRLSSNKKQNSYMTTLFRRLKPPQKFRITLYAIAKILKIPKHLIVRVECWAYVVFVHRTDQGGQFISYRLLEQWQNAVACQIQNCSTLQQLRSLWQAIEEDYQHHSKQYDEGHYPFVCKIWTKCWDKLWNEQKLGESAVGF